MIRVMAAGDIAACLALWRSAEGLVLREDTDNPEALRRFLDRNPGFSFVAEQAGEVVGGLLCGHDGRRAFFYHLAVAPACRRQGLATRLLQAACTALAPLGLGRAHVFVLPDNVAAARFWARAGAQERRDLQVRTLPLAPGVTRP